MKIEAYEPHVEREYETVTFDSHDSGAAKRDDMERMIKELDEKAARLSKECQQLAKELQRERQTSRLLRSVIVMQAIEIKQLKEEEYDPD